MKDSTQPYNELPLLPPAISISTNVYKSLIRANKSLAELKGLSELLPNPAIIINSLVLIEAQDSSEIENIVTTQDELYKASSSSKESNDPAIKEVLNYKEALWEGYRLTSKKGLITVKEILKIQEILIGNNAGIRKQIGTALRNSRTGEVIYTPPVGKEIIQDKLKNLEQYINEDVNETDPLIKLAIQHYQFESIHPFYDGNGRTGRILNVLYLIHSGLLKLPILYLSSYIIKNKKDYYEGLQNVRVNDDWESWMLFILDAVDATSKGTINMIKSIKFLEEEVRDKIKEKLPKIYTKELTELLFKQPYIRISNLENDLGITRFTGSKYLKELENIGVLKSEKIGRDIIFINDNLLKLLSSRTM